MNALTEILSHPFVHKLGWALVHLLWQGAVIALLLAIVLVMLRKSTANLRYVAACLALAMVVVLPVVTFRLVPSPPSFASLEVDPAPLMPMMAEATKTVSVNLELSAPIATVGLKQRAVNLFEPALPYIVAGWVLGVFALSLWHLGGWTHLQHLRRRLTKQADASLLAKLSTLAEELRVTRPVRLVESAIVQIPTVVGWFRPMILLPASALTGLTEQQLEALLAHELAHIRRGDFFINMLQTIVEIFAFYHPAVWWISNKIRLERENCCDDLAVAVCSDRMHYATALAQMEKIRSTRTDLALAANGGNLLMRIRRLIGKSPVPKPRFNWAAALITALVIAAMAIPTTLALSRSRSAEDSAETAADQTVELDEARRHRHAPPVPVTDETEDKAQILFELKLFEVSADSKLIKDAAKKDGNFVRTDKAFAEKLLELSKKGKDAKLLANPRLLVIEGEEATFSITREIPYIVGYTEQPGEDPKPIKKYLLDGMELKVVARLVDKETIRTNIIFTLTRSTLSTHKIDKDREIQIPIVAKTESSMIINLSDGDTALIGDIQSPDEPKRSIIMRITPHIVRPGQELSLSDPLPIKDSGGKMTFTVTPQVTTSVRFETPVERPRSFETQEAASLIRDFAAMLKGQASATFELLELQAVVSDQLDDLRRILDGRELKIANARTLGRYAIVVSEPIEVDGEEGQLVFNLTKTGEKWVIDDIDFESSEGVKNEMRRFNDRPVKAEPVSTEPDSTAIGEVVEAPVSMAPKTGGVSEKAVTRVYALQHGKAADIVKALTDMITDTGHKIVADETSNRIIVIGSEFQHKQIESLIFQFDILGLPRVKKTAPHVRVFELRYGGANSVSDVLKKLLPKEHEDVRIMIDPHRSTRLIVEGSEDDIERVGMLIELLDGPQAAADTLPADTVTQIVYLEYADSQEVVTILANLSVLGRNSRIVSNARLNQVIIEAPEADLKKIKELIKEIDRPVDESAVKKQSIAKDKQLALLIKQREDLAEKMQSLREFISKQQQQLGITESAKQQDLMLQRTSSLLAELVKTESLRMQLEAQLSLLDQGKDPSISPQERLKMRQDYINSDATVKALAEKIAQVEMELLLAQQEKGGDHPEIKNKVSLLKALKERLAEAKDEVGQAFDKLMTTQADRVRQQNIAKAKAEIDQNMAYEEKLRTRLAQENAETNAMAQNQLQIQGLRDELEAIKAMYDEVNRRIMDIRMEPQALPTLYDMSELTDE